MQCRLYWNILCVMYTYWNMLCAMYTVLKYTMCNVGCIETYSVQCIPIDTCYVQCIMHWNIICTMYSVLKHAMCNVGCIETYPVQCVPYSNTFKKLTYWKTNEFTILQTLCIVSHTIKLLNNSLLLTLCHSCSGTHHTVLYCTVCRL